MGRVRFTHHPLIGETQYNLPPVVPSACFARPRAALGFPSIALAPRVLAVESYRGILRTIVGEAPVCHIGVAKVTPWLKCAKTSTDHRTSPICPYAPGHGREIAELLHTLAIDGIVGLTKDGIEEWESCWTC
jgi:hypothetical protein